MLEISFFNHLAELPKKMKKQRKENNIKKNNDALFFYYFTIILFYWHYYIFKKMSHFSCRNTHYSASYARKEDVYETRKNRIVRIVDLKEPKMDLLNSSKNYYGENERVKSKNSTRKRIKIMENSRFLKSNKSNPRLISYTEEKGKNLISLRTFSPSMEKISSKLSEKRKQKITMRRQEEIIEKLSNVLEEYKKQLGSCRVEKENLKKENKKLKDKMNNYFSTEAYRNHQYNILQ